jgi:spermidine synthase
MELKQKLFENLNLTVEKVSQNETHSNLYSSENFEDLIKIQNRVFTKKSLKSYTEMLIHTALNTHKEAKSILIVGGVQSSVFSEINRYYDLNLNIDFIDTNSSINSTLDTVALSEKHKLNLIEQEPKDYISRQPNDAYDVIILDEVSDFSLDKVLMAHISRVLDDTGVFVTFSNLLGDNGSLVQNMSVVANEFHIAMPYFVNLVIPATVTFILASKKYHPTADIILQRADLLDGLNYYNSEIQEASFKQPNNIRKLLKGIVKN